jgi:hypothetical protein
MFEINMMKSIIIAAPLIAAWGFNSLILSFSRSASTLIKLSVLIFLGPLAGIQTPTSVNGNIILGYLVLAAFVSVLILSLYLHIRQTRMVTGLFSFIMLFSWFFIAVLYYEIDE